jgi:hypothetical protein
VSKVRGLTHTVNIGILSANPFTLEDSYWLLLRTAYIIGPMSADQHKQIVTGEVQGLSS